MNVGDLVISINSSYPETKLGEMFLVSYMGKYGDRARILNLKTYEKEVRSVCYLRVINECR